MILITGATGTTGKEIVERFKKSGAPVRAIVRDPQKATGLSGKGVQVIRGDLGDRASLEPAMTGAEAAFLLTAVDQRQIEWQTNFIEAARVAGIPYVVKYSGMNARLDSPSQLLRMHASTDQLLMESGINYAILRPNSFMQNLFGSAGSIVGSGVLYMPMKEARQSIVDVRDIAECAVKVLTAPSAHLRKIYSLTGPEALSFDEIAGKLSAALGKPVKYVDVPNEAAVQGMLQAGMPRWNAEAVGELLQYFAAGGASQVTGELAAILGRAPTSFDRFAADHREIFAAGR